MAGEAGMGLYAMLAARFNRLREEGKATVPRRLWAVLESILSYRAPHVRIYADGQSVYCGRAAGATLVISGEFPEGHFELTLQPGGCRMTCLRLFYKLFRGKPYDLPGSLHWRGREIRIETDNIFAVEADGDPLGDTPLGFRITEAAVRLALPAPATDRTAEESAPYRYKRSVQYIPRNSRPSL